MDVCIELYAPHLYYQLLLILTITTLNYYFIIQPILYDQFKLKAQLFKLRLDPLLLAQQIMIQIAKVPYKKIYKFAYFSDVFFLKIILYGLSILLPFFMVFSVNNFYLSFTDKITTNSTITYDYHYHLTIETSKNVYTYTTLYKNTVTKAISFAYQDNQNQNTHLFSVNWPKTADERVKKVNLVAFMKYSTDSVGYGMVVAEGTGYDIADLNVIGTMQIATGLNKLNNPPSTNLLPSNNYDVGATMLALQKNYKRYLKSSTQHLANNMPNNLLKFSAKFKAASIVFQQESASILGQLIWSFTQFFPISCAFMLFSSLILEFLLRENILKRSVIHDKFF